MTAAGRVVVVGAGVTGASVAWHLLQAGVKDVVVIDRGVSAGLGSTAAATGGFRAQFSSAVNVRLSLLAREKLRRFREEVGADPKLLSRRRPHLALRLLLRGRAPLLPQLGDLGLAERSVRSGRGR